MSNTAWSYPDPPETKVLALRSILEGRPILFVERDENSDWRFLDGERVLEPSEIVLVPLGRVVDLDASVNELADLPAGWRAWRELREQAWEKESSKTKERTRARMAQLLAEMEKTRITLPPGTPSTVEMLREDRDR